MAHLALLVRGHGAVVVRGAAVLALGAVLAGLALRNGDVEHGTTRLELLLVFFSPALVWFVAGCAGPVLRAETQMRWLLDVCGTGSFVRIAGPGLAAAVAGAVAGLVHGAWALGTTTGSWLSNVDVLAMLAVAGAVIAWTTVSALRLANRGRRRVGGFMTPLVISVVVVLPLMHGPRAALCVWSLAMIVLSALDLRTVAKDRHRGRLSGGRS